MGDNRYFVCTKCQVTMPTTEFHTMAFNPMLDKLQSLSPEVHSAAAYLYHIHGGSWRNVIHTIKYREGWYLGYKVGRIYGEELKDSPYFSDVDLVVPIPLHPIKKMRRGYNQSDYIARGIAKSMGKKCCTTAIRRWRNNPSQVRQTTESRWGNVDGIFKVSRPKLLEGRKIVLVDDVFTTGATMLSCIDTILAEVPSCRISVVTLAVSQRHIGFME